jgi:hypothetical protein
LFDHLHAVGTTRDRAGNRQLFYDQYATLLLLYFFNPTVTSLRGLQQMTTFAHVQAQFGIRRTSLGALSEAASVFDAALLHAVLTALSAQLQPHLSGAEQAALVSLTAVDGSLLPALPRMLWAVWQDDQHRAAKMHVAFAVLRHGPVDVTVTAGNASERAELRRLVQPGGFYVFDRGYIDYDLFQELHDLPCSFLGRVKAHVSYEVQEEHPVSAAARAAGVKRDVVLRRLGTAHPTRLLPQPFRLVQVATGKTDADGTPEVMVLVTNRLDLDAELVALAYRYRWAVEVCQTQPIKMTWCSLRLFRQTRRHLRGAYKRENELDVYRFARHNDFADQALGDGLPFFKRELGQILAQQLAKGRSIVHHLLPMDALLPRLR